MRSFKIFHMYGFFLISLKEFFNWGTLARSRIPYWFLFQSIILGLCGFHLWDFTGAEFQKIPCIISLCGFSLITLKEFFYWSALTRSRIPSWFFVNSKYRGSLDCMGSFVRILVPHIFSLCGFTLITLKKFFHWNLDNAEFCPVSKNSTCGNFNI